MINWKDETSDINVISWDKFPFEQLKIDKNKFYDYIHQGKCIFFKKSTWAYMWEYGKSSTNEMGGLLLGYVYKRNEDYIWYVDDVVVHDDYEHSSFHLILYPSLWQKANSKILNEQFLPEKFITGWFHTHPNFQPFFSSTDKKTHEHFFHFDYSLGIVLDPFSNQFKVYTGSICELYKNTILIEDLF